MVLAALAGLLVGGLGGDSHFLPVGSVEPFEAGMWLRKVKKAKTCKKVSGFKPTSTLYSLECFVLSYVIRICTKTKCAYYYRDHMSFKSNYIKLFQKFAVLCLISFIVPEISLKVFINKCSCLN